jgi:hypothetical protein
MDLSLSLVHYYVIDAREDRHYIQSEEDWNSMTDEKKMAIGCIGPSVNSPNDRWEGAFVS